MLLARTRRLAVLAVLAALTLVAPLAHAQTTPTSVQVTWTAPGDDGNVGTAAQYDLRYSTSTITSANFAAASRWNGTPTPAAAGTSQTTTITGLSPSTLYYFALKTADDAGNWSTLSNVVSKATLAATDVTAPAALAISVGTVTDTTAVINWTATGDDSLTGTATSYDLRWSTSPITLANWSSATTVTGEPVPAASGTSQSYTVRGLQREGTYYFAVRVTDDAGNVSGLSNVPSTTTPDTVPPSALLNLTANFMWLSWHTASAGAVEPRVHGSR